MKDKDSQLIFEAYTDVHEATEISMTTPQGGSIQGSSDFAKWAAALGISSHAVAIAAMYAPWQSVLVAAIPGIGGLLVTFGVLGWVLSKIPGVKKFAGIIVKRLFGRGGVERTSKELEATIQKVMESQPDLSYDDAKELVDRLLAEVGKDEGFQSQIQQLAQKCDGPNCDDQELLQLTNNLDNTKENIITGLASQVEDWLKPEEQVNESHPDEWNRWGNMPVHELIKLISNNDRDKVEDLGEAIEETTFEQYGIMMRVKTPTPMQTLWVRAIANVQKYSDIKVNGYAADLETFERAREDLYQSAYDMIR